MKKTKYKEKDKKEGKKLANNIKGIKLDDLEKIYWILEGVKIAKK